MTIGDITDRFCRYGFTMKEGTIPDIAFAMKQKFIDKKSDDEVISRDDITYTYSNGEGLSFVIFEVYSAHSNGVGYEDPDYKHFFHNFGGTSDVYHEKDLTSMFRDLHNLISSELGVGNLRNMLLEDLGI